MCKMIALFVLCVLISPSYLYNGDICYANNCAGSCKLLSLCPSLVNEVRRAGTPMPPYMRRKLQDLGCGFQQDEPLVCCVKESNTFDYTDDTRKQPDYWAPTEPPKPYTQPNIQVNNRGETNGIDQPLDVRNHPNLQLLPKDCGTIEGDRIFGGNRTSLFEMPWMVLLSYQTGRGIKLSCGGTLITEWYILTAAHCVSFLGNKLQLEGVILGEHDVRQNPDCERVDGELMCAPPARNVTIDRVITHPGYNPQTLFDDIALVRLSEPADFSLDSMKAVCLPTTPELINQTLEGLQGINIYNGSPRIYDSQLCAGGVRDKDSCGGDSGGPLMYPGRTNSRGGVRYVQHGIVSYGSKRCGIGGYPGVYTRISYYMEWILDNLS
ncbi:unnamed protein product [Pieris macdunnoughi]|uniref:CLIP domain-containing serine protease n=1 Tax=Pieris macdunnoughi TaxID=345717 RepID=A0A821TAW5_9NEOP|nr:unnamed protein product [Pieris macdunnoughi]